MNIDDATFLVGRLTLELEMLKAQQRQQDPLIQKLWLEKQVQDYENKVKQFASFIQELGCD